MNPLFIALFVLLVAISAGAIAYAILSPAISNDRKIETRLSAVTRSDNDRAVLKTARDRLQEQNKRRRTIQSSLKDLESRQKEKSKHTAQVTLARRLDQAGLTLMPQHFIMISVGLGVFGGVASFMFLKSPLYALGIAVVVGLGLPRFWLTRLRKKRLERFINEFPNAIDLIVRGIRSGLPLNDTMRMIASETVEPVRGEFLKIVEAQQMGMSVAEAVERLYRNVPVAETNFFSIVVTIQAQAGGNLSEALANLSRVLRERKKMKGKIQAMSMEAKASGWIIGSLPVIVGTLVFLTTPDYISILFTSATGHIILGCSALWMTCGILVMKKMIAFDF